jgi:hypothetical protein
MFVLHGFERFDLLRPQIPDPAVLALPSFRYPPAVIS